VWSYTSTPQYVIHLYLTFLAKNVGVIVKNELGRVWKEVVLAYFRVLSQYLSRGGSVITVARLWPARPGFDFRQCNVGTFYLRYCVQTCFGAHQAPFPMVTGDSFSGVKRTSHETGHSPQSSAEVKKTWSCTSTPPHVFMAWCLVKHRDNFTFTLQGKRL
jgi:hypothetical protein